ncbi:hypothetical protein CPL00151_CDS0020 [Escherichia phage Delraymugoa]
MPIMARIDMLLSIVRRIKYYEYGVEMALITVTVLFVVVFMNV